jgi:transposase
MDYFAGLDISMDETHVCVVDREGVVVHQSKTASTAAAIAVELAKAPSCRRIVFETGRMAPILFHGLSQLGLPVVCVESRQAYQALKSLATHKTDRNDARGLAHLARTGFFKPVHVKSLPAHAIRSLISARKKLVGQRVTLENQIRGLAVVFGVRLPRALNAAFIDQALKASEGVAGLSAAMRGLIAARTAVMTAVAAIDADMRRMAMASAACSRLMTIPGVGQLTALAFVAAVDVPSRIRRSRDIGAYLGLVPRRYQSGEVDYVGSISKCGDRRVRTLLYEAANVMLTRYKGQLKLKDWAFAIAKRSTMRKATLNSASPPSRPQASPSLRLAEETALRRRRSRTGDAQEPRPPDAPLPVRPRIIGYDSNGRTFAVPGRCWKAAMLPSLSCLRSRANEGSSDSAFVPIYTISAFLRRGRPDSTLVRIATAGPIDRTASASASVWPLDRSASTCRSFATISSGPYLFLAILTCSSTIKPGPLREADVICTTLL